MGADRCLRCWRYMGCDKRCQRRDAADSGDLMSEFPALRLDEKLGPLPELAERRLAVTGGSVKTEAGDG